MTRHLVRACCGLLFAMPGVVSADDTGSSQAISAAMLFNFMKFTEWPVQERDQPRMTVCFATNDAEQAEALEGLSGRRARASPLDLVRFRPDVDCDVIYVDKRQQWRKITAQNDSEHALTIGNYVGFATDGGMIEISLERDGEHFDINLNQAKRAGLRLYPQLLKLARRIVE